MWTQLRAVGLYRTVRHCWERSEIQSRVCGNTTGFCAGFSIMDISVPWLRLFIYRTCTGLLTVTLKLCLHKITFKSHIYIVKMSLQERDVLAHSSEGKSISKKASINENQPETPGSIDISVPQHIKTGVFLLTCTNKTQQQCLLVLFKAVRLWHRQLFKVWLVHPCGLMSTFLAV